MTSRRHQAREAALQILYFWEVGRTDAAQAIEAYFAAHQPEASDESRAFAARLVNGTIAGLEPIDRLIEQHSAHWRLERLAALDRLILRMATWELQHEPDVPAPVVIDEALELARTFSTDESVKFVNGVLDAIRQALGRA
jgi:N utilization substance protein B